MGVTLTDVLLFGKAGSTDVDNAKFAIYRRNILRWGGIAGYVDMIVSGVPPLSLPDAVANSLQYVKAFGKTEQRNLPDGYIQRQFIYMMDGAYLLTDLVPTYDCKIEMDFQTTNVPTNAFGGVVGGRTATYGGLQFITNYTDKKFILDAFGSSSADRYNSGVVAQDNTRYKFTFDNKVATLESGGSVLFTNTFTGTGSTGAALCINAVNDNGTPANNSMGIYLYSFKMWDNQGNLIADYVPAIQKGTVPVVGFYDTVSGTFKTATAGTFAAGGEAVPTPDAPMDIVSNNGVLKARHASGLPLGYTLLDYIESSGTQYIDTGVVPTLDYEFEIKAIKQQNRSLIGSGDDEFVLTGNSANNYAYVGSTATNLPNTIDSSVVHIWAIKNNKLYCDTTSADITKGASVPTVSLYLFARNESGTASNIGSHKMYYAKIWNNSGVLVFNGIPAKNSSNVIGMYDTVSGQFFTNAGTGDFVAGDPVSDPVEIYADGVVETIGIRSPNLFDANACTDNYYYNVNLEYMGNQLLALSDYIPVTAGRTYTISGNTSITLTLRINFFDSNKTIISQTAVGNLSGDYNETFTVPAGISYMRYIFDKTQKNSQKVSYMTSTATAEMLLSLGDYTDEQEIISGAVTRKLDVKVFDGTEYWRELTNSRGYFYGVNANDPCRIGVNYADAVALCTHFNFVIWSNNSNPMPTNSIGYNIYGATNTTNGNMTIRPDMTVYDTVEKWKAYLAEQYANGTPVIVVRMIEPTTDTVTGQPMNTTAGDNILEITQASLDGLEVEVKYQKVV